MVKIYFTSKSGAFLQSEVKVNDAVDFANDFLDNTYTHVIVAFENTFNNTTKTYIVSKISNTITVEIVSQNKITTDSIHVENKDSLLKKLISADRSFIKKIAVYQ